MTDALSQLSSIVASHRPDAHACSQAGDWNAKRADRAVSGTSCVWTAP